MENELVINTHVFYLNKVLFCDKTGFLVNFLYEKPCQTYLFFSNFELRVIIVKKLRDNMFNAGYLEQFYSCKEPQDFRSICCCTKESPETALASLFESNKIVDRDVYQNRLKLEKSLERKKYVDELYVYVKNLKMIKDIIE